MSLFPAFSPSSAAPVTVEFVASVDQTADSNTRTWTDASIGAAHANRKVVIAFGCGDNDNGGLTVASATIGGSAATIEQQQNEAPGNGNGVACAILSRAVPTGTTATIVITLTGTPTAVRSHMASYRMLNAGTSRSDQDATAGESSGVQTNTLTIPANGAAISVAVTYGGTITQAWAVLTEGSDAVVESCGVSTAYGAFSTLQNEVSITATETGSGNSQDAMCSVAWESA